MFKCISFKFDSKSVSGKHLCPNLLFKKLEAEACNFIKKEAPAQIFLTNLVEFLRTAFCRTTMNGCVLWKINVYKFVVNCQVFEITPSGCTLQS